MKTDESLKVAREIRMVEVRKQLERHLRGR
jgi:hypothetical protein